MSKQIVGHYEVISDKPQLSITYPQFWRKVLITEGIGKVVAKIDTETGVLTVEPVREDFERTPGRKILNRTL
jgi:hypothetical protein